VASPWLNTGRVELILWACTAQVALDKPHDGASSGGDDTCASLEALRK